MADVLRSVDVPQDPRVVARQGDQGILVAGDDLAPAAVPVEGEQLRWDNFRSTSPGGTR